MSLKILLLEPSYKNKYPSLGLMKLATYHENNDVYLRKGHLKDGDPNVFDRVYVSSLFTFEWKKTIDAIEYAKRHVNDPQNDIYLGGPAATLLEDQFITATGVRVVPGLLTSDRLIGYNRNVNIDLLIPNYTILEQVEADQYKYPLQNAYIGYTTRGCRNRCGFCAVNTLEPHYIDYVPLRDQINKINQKYGPRKDLVLNDNNVFASESFFRIIDEIKDIGFHRGAKWEAGPNKNKPFRYVDFNQGLDARFVTTEKMKKLAEIAIRPARIAFDDIKFEKLYVRAIELAAKNQILHLSNYILYNFDDWPEHFYKRLRINIELNKRLGTSIYSFPMKYIPLDNRNRRHLSDNWTKKQLRGVQCILNATMGKVGPKEEFFNRAFGEDEEAFKELIIMPENYIIYRDEHEYRSNDIETWRIQYRSLTKSQKQQFNKLIANNNFRTRKKTQSKKFQSLLEHYYR